MALIRELYTGLVIVAFAANYGNALTCYTGSCYSGDHVRACNATSMVATSCDVDQPICVSSVFFRVNNQTNALIGGVRTESCGTVFNATGNSLAAVLGDAKCSTQMTPPAGTSASFDGVLDSTSLLTQSTGCVCMKDLCNAGWQNETFAGFQPIIAVTSSPAARSPATVVVVKGAVGSPGSRNSAGLCWLLLLAVWWSF